MGLDRGKDAAHPLHAGKDQPQLLPGEEGGLQPVLRGDEDAPAVPLGGGYRHPRLAEGFNIPADGAGGDLEPLRQLGDCKPLLPEQQHQNPHKTVKLHRFSPPFPESRR